MRCLIAALLVLAASPASASASPALPGIGQALSVANAAWPDSPCAGRVHATADRSLAAEGRAGAATGMHAHEDRPWDLVECTIALDPVWWSDAPRYQRCLLVLHETGHLAGHRHEEGGVMAAGLGNDPRCQTMRERIVTALASRHSDDAYVTCGRWHKAVLICRAEGLRYTARYRVVRRGETFTVQRLRVTRY